MPPRYWLARFGGIKNTNMPIFSILFLAACVLATAFLSGIFGMAGGLILMGVLLSLFSVPQAMMAHGLLQMSANGWRAFLLRRDICWSILIWVILGALLGLSVLFWVAWRPQRQMIFVFLGLVPFLVWLPKSVFHLDAQKPLHGLWAGFLVTLLNTFAGVAGPALDIFFVQTTLRRHQIVATKSTIQILAHLIKVIFWGGAIVNGITTENKTLLFLIAALIPLSMLGTWGGGKILNRLSEQAFLKWLKALVSVIGAVYLIRALLAYFALGAS